MANTIDLGDYIPGRYYVNHDPIGLFFNEDERKAYAAQEALRFRIPEYEFKGHAILSGQSGSGKTETLLRLIWEVAKEWRWQVAVIDAKADAALSDQIREIAVRLGVAFASFPSERYDIWRGEPADVATRLGEVLPGGDLAGYAVAHRVLVKAVEGGVARAQTSESLLHNLANMDAVASDAEVKSRAWECLRAFFDVEPGALLNGQANIETSDIMYLGIDALRFGHFGGPLAALLLREIADYAAHRPCRNRERPLLLIFDEFSAVPVQLATDLVERIRSHNVQVILGVQSFAGLGPHADRLVEASNWLLLHRSGYPEPFLKVLGTYEEGGAHHPLVRPIDVRRLENGQMWVGNRGTAASIAVERWTQ